MFQQSEQIGCVIETTNFKLSLIKSENLIVLC